MVPVAVAGEMENPLDRAAGEMEISFDGHCDGLHLNYNTSTGMVTGFKTGCRDEPISGTVGIVHSQGVGVTYSGGYNFPEAGFVYVVRANRTWSIYNNDGGGAYELNSGTWSIGAPVVAAQSLFPSSLTID